MIKVINTRKVAGYLYGFDRLEEKVSGPNSKNPGTHYMNGNIIIATNAEMTELIKIHFNYVAEHYTTKAGKTGTSSTFTMLKDIIEGRVKNVMDHGISEAAFLSIPTGCLECNSFPGRDGQIVENYRNSAGFSYINEVKIPNPNFENEFSCDVLIEGTVHVPANDETGESEKLILKSNIFTPSKNKLPRISPFEFCVTLPKAIEYFEDQHISKSQPMFTRIHGKEVSQVITTKTIEECAWDDEPNVIETTKTRKAYEVTRASREPYPWDVEGSITAIEVQEMVSAREMEMAAQAARMEQSAQATPPAGNVMAFDNFSAPEKTNYSF